jgi:methylenetetrahydrofolate dehydrogenase (NADP+)/methenyltetrahydrofolate cyclohydrolase
MSRGKRKHTVVIGRSHIVAVYNRKKRFPQKLFDTQLHKTLKRLPFRLISLSQLRVPNYLKANMVKDGVVIDVGITRVPDESKKRICDYWRCRF